MYPTRLDLFKKAKNIGFSCNIMVLSLATGCWNFNLPRRIISTIASESWFRLISFVIPVTSFGDQQIDQLSHLIISIEWRSIKTYASRDCRCRQHFCDEIVAMRPHWVHPIKILQSRECLFGEPWKPATGSACMCFGSHFMGVAYQ